MWLKCCMLVFLLGGEMPLPAQTQLTLEGCIGQALKLNPGLAVQRLEKRIARDEQLAAWGELMPEVTTEARLGKRSGKAIDPGTNLFATQDFVEGALNLDIAIPLFEGFTRLNKIAFQRFNRERNEWNVIKQENEVAFEVMEAFYQVLFQQQLCELAQEQRQLSERYVQQTAELVKEGVKAPVDLQEMKARLSSDTYQETVRKNTWQVALLELKQLIWMKPEDSLQIVFSEREIEPMREWNLAARVYEQARQFLPEFQLMELNREISRKSVALERGKLVPSLKGNIGVYTGYYDTEKNANGQVISPGKQLDNNLNKYFGVTLSLPLLTGLQNFAGLRKSKTRLQQTEYTIKMQQQQLYIEIEKACLSLAASVDETVYADGMQRSEKQILEQMEEKWNEGLVSVFELMEARNRYFVSRAEVVRTRLQYSIKRKTMDFYQGKPWVKN